MKRVYFDPRGVFWWYCTKKKKLWTKIVMWPKGIIKIWSYWIKSI